MGRDNERDQSERDRYRDNNDVRRPLQADDRSGVKPDTKSEARGDAREAVGDNTRGTDADPKDAERNDKTRNTTAREEFDRADDNIGE